jgi:hypothetical protein
MARALHLLQESGLATALPVIERQSGDPDVRVTVVLLHGMPSPALPDGVRAARLGAGLDYPGLLDLIFASDHVIAW